MRKILHNNNKSKRLNGTSEGKIGTILGIQDKNGEYLVVGDSVKYGNYKGVLLYNYHYDQYGVALDCSMQYDGDKYSIDSYGKFVKIPMDNGARMNLERIREYNR